MKQIRITDHEIEPKNNEEQMINIDIIISEKIDNHEYREIVDSNLNPTTKIRVITNLYVYKIIYTYKYKDKYRMKLYKSIDEMKDDFNIRGSLLTLMKGIK